MCYGGCKKSGCGVPFTTVRINDLEFADDAVIFAKTHVYQLRTRSQFTTRKSLERDEFAARMCGAADTCAKNEGPSISLAGPVGLGVFLRELDSDRRAVMDTELPW